MARLVKNEAEKKIDPREFILPLPKETLQAMWEVYFDDEYGTNGRMKGFKYFTICNKANRTQTMKIPAEMMFKFKNKVWSPNWYSTTGGPSYSFYMGDDRGDYDKIDTHWKQFEDYANKRAYAKEKEAEGWSEFAIIPGDDKI